MLDEPVRPSDGPHQPAWLLLAIRRVHRFNDDHGLSSSMRSSALEPALASTTSTEGSPRSSSRAHAAAIKPAASSPAAGLPNPITRTRGIFHTVLPAPASLPSWQWIIEWIPLPQGRARGGRCRP